MQSRHANFQRPGDQVADRIEPILNQMTLDEKIAMLGGIVQDPNGNTIGVERLGIPQLKMADGPVGVHWWCDSSTAYPATLALAATWDTDLGYRMGKAIGRDCRARGIHILLAPGVNIYRSPLCGRNFEYMGEDPCLTSEMVVGYIRGCQDQGVATTVKHYAGNFQEYDRHGISTDADERTLREVYLPAFEAAICEAGSACLMTAYNLVNGQHASEQRHLLLDILKGEWGFEGVVMSDWVSTYSTVQAANHGLDLEMPNARHLTKQKLEQALANGLLTDSVIDDKIRRHLRLMACFGWLDHPQLDATIPREDPGSWQVALETARRGCVLLKNRQDTLPLAAHKLSSLAVIGSHASQPVIGGGGSSYTPPNHLTSILEGIRELAPAKLTITHAKGDDPWRHEPLFQRSAFQSPDGQPGLRSQWFKGRDREGEPDLERTDSQIDFQWHGLPPLADFPPDDWRAVWHGSLTAESSGEYIFYLGIHEAAHYSLRVADTLVIDSKTATATNIQEGRITLTAGQRYEVELCYTATRNWNSVRLGYEPAAAIDADLQTAIDLAREADAVVLCAGYTKETESEGFDRSFSLPPRQEQLIRAVTAANSRTILVLHAGGNVDMNGWYDSLAGLLHAWYPGQEGGQAIAEILFGEINPSGRLPMTCEYHLEDRSSHESYHDTDGDGHVQMSDGVFGGYRHMDRAGITPRFPFGFGLSYTTFSYDNLRVDRETIRADQSLTVSIEVTNTGARAGAEVVQLYIGDPEASVVRPEKELKAFARVELEPGETRTVDLHVSPRAFQYFCPDHGWTTEPGAFEVMVGASALDIRQQCTIEIR